MGGGESSRQERIIKGSCGDSDQLCQNNNPLKNIKKKREKSRTTPKPTGNNMETQGNTREKKAEQTQKLGSN